MDSLGLFTYFNWLGWLLRYFPNNTALSVCESSALPTSSGIISKQPGHIFCHKLHPAMFFIRRILNSKQAETYLKYTTGLQELHTIENLYFRHCHLHLLIFNSDYCSTWWISNLQYTPYDIMYVNYNRKCCLKELPFHCFVSPFLIDVNVSFLYVKVYTTEARRCYVGTPAQTHIYSWMYIHPYVHTHQMIHLGQASMYKNYLPHSVACMWTQK